jgi:hypothetical protein
MEPRNLDIRLMTSATYLSPGVSQEITSRPNYGLSSSNHKGGWIGAVAAEFLVGINKKAQRPETAARSALKRTLLGTCVVIVRVPAARSLRA